MRDPAEARTRWQETLKHSSNFTDLQRAVKFNGPTSPCVAGCRSVCWKTFLLFQTEVSSDWAQILLKARNAYSSFRDQHLQYIKHPEQLNDLPYDPLADDPNSPWDALRRDELIRAEILQDVQRLPDEPFYHEERIQTMILDILFIYCKLNPTAGGYRQGMHELLAPIVFIIDQDAVDRTVAGSDADQTMLEMLDSNYVEHDAYALFSKIMERAGSFYELGDPNGASADRSAIVEKSKYIHEVVLMKIDPDLATHLKNIEVLPQIFLIRWVRLLFGREFPLEQLLELWDTIFAFDPTLDLIDLICAAMLLRIRWTLLEADYSVALQLLLRYPAPEPPHGPYTFVDDAIYLKGHLNPAGGSTLILKYTGKAPASAPPPPAVTDPRASTPSSLGLHLRQRTLGARSPLSTPAKFLQTPGGVEALFQGAAKGVIERGEKLGINQAVRDAVGEIRRNVQGFQEARTPGRSTPRDVFIDDNYRQPSLAVALVERRDRQLATMLDETITNLRDMVTSKLDGDKDKYVEALEVAAAKIQFVKVHLEDPSLGLPEEEMPAINALSISSPRETRRPTVALDTTPVVMTSSAVETVRSTLSSPGSTMQNGPTSPPPSDPLPDGTVPLPVVQELSAPDPHPDSNPDKMDTDIPDPRPEPEPNPSTAPTSSPPQPTTASTTSKPLPRRPAPVPTRSSIAQSSFSWMLEPDGTQASSPLSSSYPASSSDPSPSNGSSSQGGQGQGGHKKRPSSGRRNNKNAFLFGEVVSSESEGEGVRRGEIFGLKTMGK
ncbi:RabGAP/TBC [Coniochaeta ligniaria NRRL 30616]|uniref:RabGAP/TBC n=1 Tax=Coniochaeta ligniaria NRRL 30616 TaxID=1408157 RepID=A0A1J7JV55_9PEZI|nr:RabGAP/TBC [Coniochaeta ligniaria NRRL 30616]